MAIVEETVSIVIEVLIRGVDRANFAQVIETNPFYISFF